MKMSLAMMFPGGDCRSVELSIELPSGGDLAAVKVGGQQIIVLDASGIRELKGMLSVAGVELEKRLIRRPSGEVRPA
jgi:hypothetical protein